MSTDLTIELEDRPGELARVGEILGSAGVNIDLVYGTGGRLVIGVDDMEKAKGAI
jgi:hypothetical protein